MYKRQDQNWDLINKRMEAESGTIAIAWHSQGFRFITNSKQPVAKLADLAPVKIRTPNNPIMIGVYRAWGTDPVPMAMDETFNALQQKVVDGQDNPLVSIATNRFYEVQKYITEPHYKLWTGPVVVNVAWLRSLPADVQQAIIEAGPETTVEMRALLDKQESASREFLKEKGMVFCGAVSYTHLDVYKRQAYTRGHDGGKAACHFFGGFANVTGATGAAWDGMAILFRKNGKRICPLSAVFFAEGKH